eukprot:3065637-Pyramimonas_sp.AAC.2
MPKFCSAYSSGAHICPHWGTKQFKGCLFMSCANHSSKSRRVLVQGRSKEYPNPNAKKRTEHPGLPMRSDRHKECLPCGAKMRRKNPDIKTAAEKNAYSGKLAEDNDAYYEHMQA